MGFYDYALYKSYNFTYLHTYLLTKPHYNDVNLTYVLLTYYRPSYFIGFNRLFKVTFDVT